MPITLQDITEHKDYYGLHNLETMTKEEYQQVLNADCFFWVDHHDRVRHQLSGEIIAMNKQQLDLLIEHLKSFREGLPNQIKLK